MDRITDVTPEFASGIGLALLTIFFTVPPLAFARFALVLIALHACVVLPFTSFMILAVSASGDLATNWPLVLILLVLLLLLGTVDAKGLRAWTHVFRHAAQARPASVANRFEYD